MPEPSPRPSQAEASSRNQGWSGGMYLRPIGGTLGDGVLTCDSVLERAAASGKAVETSVAALSTQALKGLLTARRSGISRAAMRDSPDVCSVIGRVRSTAKRLVRTGTRSRSGSPSQQFFNRDRQIANPLPGRVIDSIRDRRRYRNCGQLSEAL